MARARVAGVKSEIEQYRKTRYVSAAEATWRMLGYDMMLRSPAVTVVHAHLENEHNVMYPSNATDEERRNYADDSVSDLMRYLQRPALEMFDALTLLDYFESYTITKKKKDDPIPSSPPHGKWLDSYGNVVSARRSSHVCRIKFQSPAVGDLFYLRLILHKKPGRSFTELRTATPPSGIPTEYPTFHDAARAQGLVSGQEEFFICMEEAINFEMPSQLRGLFITLILNGGPAPKMWHDYKEHLIEDFTRTMSITDATQQALRIIDLKLQHHGKTNVQLSLPEPAHRQTEYERMRSSFNPSEQSQYADHFEPGLTSEQRAVYTAIVTAVRTKQPQPFMIDAPAGTGKSHTERVIAARLRGEGYTVLIVASTGIAALQLPGGWTAHSLFKLPLNERVVQGAYCDIKNESQRADLIRKCDLIIFDELPITHRFCVEALERTLRDIRKSQALYGGIPICFSGDWRQCGPVVPFGAAADTVEASFISSDLWPKTKRMRLTISQRDKEDPAYASFVRSIGENKQPMTTFPDGSQLTPLTNEHDTSTTDHFSLKHTTHFDDLIRFVYPDIHEDSKNLTDRAILATTNASIDSCNNEISSRRRGNEASFSSSDTLITDDTNPSATAFSSPENLNGLNVPGVPPHKLDLKSDTLAMLIRNLNFSEGLVNGQKVVLRGISPNSRVIQVELLHDNSIVLIPRISFHAQVGRNGITFNRCQFPLRIAYSLTINKSQGQTLSRIGVDLRSDCFAHGQLYVALSRAKNRHSVMILLPPDHLMNNIPHVANCVYDPFIEAATFDTSSPPPPPPNVPPTNPHPPLPPPSHTTWSIVSEIGDGACGFRGIARRIYNDPNKHAQVRSEIVQYMSDNRNNPTFQTAISTGINTEYLNILGEQPRRYASYDQYLTIMSHPRAYLGQPEIVAATLRYNIQINTVLNASHLPHPSHADPSVIHLIYDEHSQHYSSGFLTSSPSPLLSPG